MLSKIKFDINEQGLPIVTSEIAKRSDDLRDKVAARFFENNMVKTFIVAQVLPDLTDSKYYQLEYVADIDAVNILHNKLLLYAKTKEEEDILNEAFLDIFNFLRPGSSVENSVG